MEKHHRDVCVVNVRNGQITRVIRVESNTPISSSAAIHEAIKQSEKK